jgi:outer membrane protein
LAPVARMFGLSVDTITNQMRKDLLGTEGTTGVPGRYVVVALPDGSFEMRLVKTGPTDLRTQSITEGLKEGDRVVMLGAIIMGKPAVPPTLRLAASRDAGRRATDASRSRDDAGGPADSSAQTHAAGTAAARGAGPGNVGWIKQETVKASTGSLFAFSYILISTACVHSTPSIDGVASTPASSSALWNPPSSVVAEGARDAKRPPPPVAGVPNPAALQHLTVADVVDIALRNSPVTRNTWLQARASADVYGSSEGRLYPQIQAGMSGVQSRVLGAVGPATTHYQLGPTLTLTYNVLDFGGRAGSIDVARQTAVAANLTHNSTVDNTILQVEGAAFTFLSARAQRDAEKSALDLATAALDAASERHRVGLATIADVLQAQTARSQAELDLESDEGSLQVARGGLAVAMGLPANTAFEIPDVPATDSVFFVAQSMDSLIDLAIKNRPELAEARAQAAAASSQIKVARSGYLPALGFTAVGGNAASNLAGFTGNSYSVTLGVQMPVFTGNSNQYDVAAANEQYQAAVARTEATRQQVIQQVFTSYYTLRTATDRVRTARDLLASAVQSESVARGRYKEGVGSIVDLLVAQSALAAARAQDVDTRWQWRTSLAQLAHDVGVMNARGDTSFEPFTPLPNVRPR